MSFDCVQVLCQALYIPHPNPKLQSKHPLNDEKARPERLRNALGYVDLIGHGFLQSAYVGECGEVQTSGQGASIREGDGLAELSAYRWYRRIESQCLLDAHGSVGHLIQVTPKMNEAQIEGRQGPGRPGLLV